ncbi:helix-turn-helix transcriptional regulator [Haloferax sp. DFSO52]|uniref:helix-turn-helix transcriptional regulator n=1 Tax=Haloferax sp. DFSO52 TaxID=3388505 RepID=UPI003A8B38E9
MATRDAVPALLCILLCVLAVVTPAAAAQDGSATGPGVDPLVQQGVTPDSTRIVVDVEADGSAHWEIQYWTRLDDQNTTEAFQSLRDDIEANPDDYTSAFENRITDTVSSAENSTGREMTASNVSVSAETRSLPDSFGVVTYSFEWSNFAAVDGDRLVVGDAIEGFFLDSSSRLILSWPDEYGAVTVEPEADEMRENTAIWRGSETEFVSGEPRLVLEAGAGGAGTETNTQTDEEPGPAVDDPFPTTTALGVLAVVAVVLVGGVFYLRSRGIIGGDDEYELVSESTTPDTAGEEDAEADSVVAEPPRDETAASADTADDEAAEDVPPELLSNEERVLRLIESRGGRIKQQEVAGALDWTDAKTSKVVRAMRDDGTIEGFRLGRENVLRLPENDDETEDV